MNATLMSQDEAQAYRAAHDAEVKSLSRKPKHELAAISRAELAARGITRVYGGPVSKDEFISDILNIRYPVERLNEAIHVLHHRDGLTNSACEHCGSVTG